MQKMNQMILEDLDKGIVRAFLGFYKLQESQGPCSERRRTRAGRFGKTFKSLVRNFEGQNTNNSLDHVAQAVQNLPDEFEFETTTLDGSMLHRRLVKFDWAKESTRFPDPLGLTLAHHVLIRGVKNVGWALELVAPDDDLVTSASDIAGWTSLHYVAIWRERSRTESRWNNAPTLLGKDRHSERSHPPPRLGHDASSPGQFKLYAPSLGSVAWQCRRH
ncbi:hypothetical protein CEP54_012540 [Fusarium duplospermum]|uniref:Uncharacterized protein n=1 Tax=Fusarium duplospermum TaxID=1325734 RepID=A0A428P7Y0_9HYPO|nr:hypothetical protein CEP54_012540 [Fusarium duplospermum]